MVCFNSFLRKLKFYFKKFLVSQFIFIPHKDMKPPPSALGAGELMNLELIYFLGAISLRGNLELVFLKIII